MQKSSPPKSRMESHSVGKYSLYNISNEMDGFNFTDEQLYDVYKVLNDINYPDKVLLSKWFYSDNFVYSAAKIVKYKIDSRYPNHE